ncbi:hypothetical protein ACFWB2_42765 [Streptomyces virginiae]|uniref:hypothetical protein n=1 Tax=Streptomyces virginiae TaxID=1961 RepID=UPI00369C5082
MSGPVSLSVAAECEVILARLHRQAAQGVPGIDVSGWESRLRAKLLLRALAQLTLAAPPPDPYARQFHTSLRKLINERMRPVTEGKSAAAWLMEALRSLDHVVPSADDGRYDTWVKAAALTMTALLHASEPDALLPARSVYALGERVRANIASTLSAVEGLGSV